MAELWQGILMSKQTLQDKCASCGVQWKSRKPTSYKDLGSKSIPMISGMQLLSEFKTKRIKLMFCDKHGNYPYFEHTLRFVNRTGVLQVRNVITNRWRKAEKIGVIIK